MPTAAPGVKDPNHTAWDVVDNTPYEPGNQGGKTKIVKTDLSGPSGSPMHSVNRSDVLPGSVAEGPTLPVAAKIAISTFGDPNNSAGDFPTR